MSQDNRYELWKRSRADTNVPGGFADRVMGVIHDAGNSSRQRLLERFLLAVLATRMGRAAVCVSASALFIVRIAHLFSLFVTM